MKKKFDYAFFFATKDVARALTPADVLRVVTRVRDEILAPLRKMCVVRGNPPDVVELAQRVDSGCVNLTTTLNQDSDLSHESSSPRLGG